MLLPCLVHVMFGCGLPVALQNRLAPFPSSTTCRGSGAVMITAESASFKQIEVMNKEYYLTLRRLVLKMLSKNSGMDTIDDFQNK